MKAIILAAGYGNRMRPLTDNEHKTLLKINGISIITNIVNSLVRNDVKDIVIVTGYRAEELKKYLIENHGHEVSFEFVHNEIYKKTNNIYSLALAFNQVEINSDIILIESDLFYKHSVIEQLIKSKYSNVALLDHYRSGMDGTVVRLNADSSIAEVIPPHIQGKDFDFSDKFKTLNIYKFSKIFCRDIFSKLLTYYAKVIDDNCYYELILGILIYMQKEKIYAEIVNPEDWVEVDDTNDMRIAEYSFNQNSRKEILEKSFGGFWNYDITDFCFIRNMYFPSDAMLAEIRNNLTSLLHNYGSTNAIVNKKLAYYLLKNEENLIALNGAAQIYPYIKERWGNKTVLMPSPTFGEYERIFVDKKYYHDNGELTIEQISSLSDDCSVIVFVNPNNPTGTLISTEDIYKFAVNNPQKQIIVDESFIDFSDIRSVLDILDDNPIDNILIVKSMSKSHGLPGVRLGYAYTSKKNLLVDIKNWLPIWNFNSVMEYFLEIMLKFRNQFQKSIELTICDRNEFVELLCASKWVKRVFDSAGDFILVETSDSIDDSLVKRLLIEKKMFIKDISSKFPSGTYFRFAVRTSLENRTLVKSINSML